ncbi:hypothetical protein PHMEG_0002659 [Phytophthora megakarya]|uniref:ISXO2-like transposase domain-containing protein n=1 Tax=Phytophthora megakarya TaxID=4795 RepID=A0A225X084_9STRA|nr:hypothetical protein PHMEG_0002659 [Phytophthora megakarya]
MSSTEYDLAYDAEAYTFEAVMAACAAEEQCILWCIRVGLLAETMTFSGCAGAMQRKEARWRCNRISCRSERSVRHNSFFAGSRLPLSKFLKILYFWTYGTHVTEAAEHVGLRLKAGGQWYAYARDICTEEMLRCDMKIGGEGYTVEIDGTSMKKKQRYNRGSKYPDYWVFGGVDRTTKKWFAKVVYDDRTKPNLSRAIKSYIKPGTLIMSDQFKSYVTEYTHQWVNHSQTFVDPTTGACTNRIVGVWEVKIKARVESE